MHTYDFTKNYEKLLTPDIVALLTQIHEYKGEQALFIEAKADTLTKLVEIAKIQSTEASNKIEGIYTSDERLKKLVQDKTTPRTRNEQEIAGYRDVLATIHESFDYIPPKASMILQLHRDLYKFSGASYGGHYKTADNVIAETDAQGNKSIRFQPLPAWETPEAVDSLCRAYEEAVGKGDMAGIVGGALGLEVEAPAFVDREYLPGAGRECDSEHQQHKSYESFHGRTFKAPIGEPGLCMPDAAVGVHPCKDTQRGMKIKHYFS